MPTIVVTSVVGVAEIVAEATRNLSGSCLRPGDQLLSLLPYVLPRSRVPGSKGAGPGANSYQCCWDEAELGTGAGCGRATLNAVAFIGLGRGNDGAREDQNPICCCLLPVIS